MLKLNEITNWEQSINQVVNADCLDFMKLLPDNSIDLVLTDPPYGINVQNRNCTASREDKRSVDKVFWDKNKPNDDVFFFMRLVSKRQIIWGANYFNCFSEGGSIVWDKLQPLPDSSQCEIASISGYKKVFKYTQRWTNFVNTKTSIHPTEKPVELMRWIIEKFTEENDLILDPFLGSGTTARACKDLNRRFIGVELEEKYCEIAESRLQQQVMQLL